ncbi:hypothetical protein ACVXG7_18360 [Enterobacter hormaechei]
MSIDFGTLVTHPLRIIILLVGFLVIKMAMLWLIARPLNVPKPQRRWFAVLLGRGVSLLSWSLAQRRWQMYSIRNGQKR